MATSAPYLPRQSLEGVAAQRTFSAPPCSRRRWSSSKLRHSNSGRGHQSLRRRLLAEALSREPVAGRNLQGTTSKRLFKVEPSAAVVSRIRVTGCRSRTSVGGRQRLVGPRISNHGPHGQQMCQKPSYASTCAAQRTRLGSHHSGTGQADAWVSHRRSRRL